MFALAKKYLFSVVEKVKLKGKRDLLEKKREGRISEDCFQKEAFRRRLGRLLVQSCHYLCHIFLSMYKSN